MLRVLCLLQFAPLKQGIAKFYNESSGLWESVWGEHMHHGAYSILLSAEFVLHFGRHLQHMTWAHSVQLPTNSLHRLDSAVGYYPEGAPPKSNAQAQIDMIEESLRWAGVTSAKSVSVQLCYS